MVSADEKEMKGTYESRKLRIQALKDEINKNQRMLVVDVVKFAMNKWMLSGRIIDSYLKELVASGNYKITTEAMGDYIEQIGGS